MEIQPPKLSKFGILSINLQLGGGGELFARFLRNSQHIYKSIGRLRIFQIGHFNWTDDRVISISLDGGISHKFSIVPSGETTERIKKVRGCKNWTDLLYHHVEFGKGHNSHANCRRKSVMFISFFVRLFVTLSSYGVCDNGNAIKQYNFQNNYDAIG